MHLTNRHLRRPWILLVALMLTSLCSPALALAAPGDSPATASELPLRDRLAIFDESIEWAMSRAATDQIISELSTLGVTTYIPCVWHGRGSYYPSELAEPDSRVAARISSGDDPLQYLLQRAHENGIKVHVWFTVVKREDETRPRFFSAGTPKGAYDIHVPEFRSFISNMILEVASTYEIDGINLDYIRSMGLCTSEPCIKSYRDFAQADLQTDINLRYIPRIRERIGRWNEAALVDILTRVRSGLESGIPISIDAHSLNRHTELQGQFPVDWANSGLINLIYEMKYSSSIPFDELAIVRSRLNDPAQLAILLSNANQIDRRWTPRTGDEVRSQLEDVEAKWPHIRIGLWHRPRITGEQADAIRHLLQP